MAPSKLTPEEQRAERRKKILKEYIWMRHESHKADPGRANKPKDDGKKGEDKEPHLDAQALLKGNLAKGVHTYAFIKGRKASRAEGKEYYAWNAWNYLGSLSKGDVRDIYRQPICGWYSFYESKYKPNFYQSFPINALAGHGDLGTYNELSEFVAYYKKISNRTLEENAQLQYASTCRSKVGMALNPNVNALIVGCSFPYTWQAHHVLPMNCFYQYLDDWHIRVILSSKYDINAGSNIIFLPAKPNDMGHHQLPYHQSSHADYDIRLKGDFKKIKETLDEMREEDKPHEDIAKASEEKLHQLETETFQYLANSYGMRKLT